MLSVLSLQGLSQPFPSGRRMEEEIVRLAEELTPLRTIAAESRHLKIAVNVVLWPIALSRRPLQAARDGI